MGSLSLKTRQQSITNRSPPSLANWVTGMLLYASDGIVIITTSDSWTHDWASSQNLMLSEYFCRRDFAMSIAPGSWTNTLLPLEAISDAMNIPSESSITFVSGL